VAPEDTRGMGSAIIALCVDEPLLEALRWRGLAQAANFTWQRTAQETLIAYQHVLAGVQ
jgi:hypothetical protein